MAEPSNQNFENHVRHDKFLYIYGAIAVAALVCGIAGLVLEPVWIAAAAILNTIVILCHATNTRTYAVKNQDRIIRLEMRLRLRDVLPQELHARVNELTASQLAALRFASDEELPALTRRALDEHLKSRDIKRSVQHWQPDHMRV